MLPDTQNSLISLLSAGGSEAWARFETLYRPPVYAYLRRRVFQDADACDLVQEVLFHVYRYPRKDRTIPFRGLLILVMRQKLIDFHRKRNAPCSNRDTWLASQPATQDDEWEREWKQHLHQRALEDVKESLGGCASEEQKGRVMFEAYYKTRIEGRPTRDVAEELGIKEGTVRVYQGRVLAMLRRRVAVLERQAEDDT